MHCFLFYFMDLVVGFIIFVVGIPLDTRVAILWNYRDSKNKVLCDRGQPSAWAIVHGCCHVTPIVLCFYAYLPCARRQECQPGFRPRRPNPDPNQMTSTFVLLGFDQVVWPDLSLRLGPVSSGFVQMWRCELVFWLVPPDLNSRTFLIWYFQDRARILHQIPNHHHDIPV